MAVKRMRQLSSGKVAIFRIKNRRGYAAVCLNHLTEGHSPAQAFSRMEKALKRVGLRLSGSLPRARG
ncbi:MAG: hypothetical protein A2Z83_05130 [Omnitrophica bacterium GWA2_52_8]|nr:MAG: hypothetical protein A2Z83_05130 [Omnitrophica bacterium GWA2_52_8]